MSFCSIRPPLTLAWSWCVACPFTGMLLRWTCGSGGVSSLPMSRLVRGRKVPVSRGPPTGSVVTSPEPRRTEPRCSSCAFEFPVGGSVPFCSEETSKVGSSQGQSSLSWRPSNVTREPLLSLVEPGRLEALREAAISKAGGTSLSSRCTRCSS